jgi:hypothetical protein
VQRGRTFAGQVGRGSDSTCARPKSAYRSRSVLARAATASLSTSICTLGAMCEAHLWRLPRVRRVPLRPPTPLRFGSSTASRSDRGKASPGFSGGCQARISVIAVG